MFINSSWSLVLHATVGRVLAVLVVLQLGHGEEI